MAPVLPCDKFKSVRSFMFNKEGSLDGEHMLACCKQSVVTTLQLVQVKMKIYSICCIFSSLNHHISQMTCCDVLNCCYPACPRFTDRQMRQFSAGRPHWLWLHLRIPHISHRLTGSGGAATLKQNQFSTRLVKGGRCLQIAVQKICPSFSQEKRSFRFINSRLKRNYLPIDLNHQQKDNRTKSCFFFSH